MTQVSDKMAAAQAAIRTGDKRVARARLQEAVKQDPQNYRAWLWLAGLAKSPQSSLDYARRAEQLSPTDPAVQKAVAWAERRVAREQHVRTETGTAAQPVSAPIHAPEARAVSSEATAIDALRQKTLAGAEEEHRQPPNRRRRLAVSLVILVIVAAAVLLWPRIEDRLASGGLALSTSTPPDELAAGATPTTGPTLEPSQPSSDLAPVSFVSGQFAAPVAEDPPVSGEESPAGATPTPPPLSIQPKPVNSNDNNPRPTWTLTPSPTFTPTATPTPVPTFVSEEVVIGGVQRPAGVGPNERWIDVNLTTQRLVAYEGDRAVFNTLVSSGTWLHPTVTGQFRVWLRYVAQTMDGRRLGYDYYLPNVPYVMYFYRDYALHGTYWHNNFGTPMSHGCVNLPTPAAEWIFNWSSIGTLVNVHY